MIERPIRLGADSDRMAVFTEPWARRDRGGDHRRTGVLFLSSGTIHRVGPGGLFVRMARVLARAGFPALRMDLAGCGDSDWFPGSMTLKESVCADAREAVDTLVREGAEDGVVVIGMGFGAREALWVADEDPRVRAVVMIDGPAHRTAGFHLRRVREALLHPRGWLREVGRRLLRPNQMPAVGREALRAADGAVGHDGYDRARPATSSRAEIERELGGVVTRGGAVLAVYTGSSLDVINDERQLEEMYPQDGWAKEIQTVLLPGADRYFSVVAEQDRLIEYVVRWARALVRTPRSESDTEVTLTSPRNSTATH